MKTIRWLPVLALLFLISVSCSDDAPTSPGNGGDQIESGDGDSIQEYTLQLSVSPDDAGTVTPEGSSDHEEDEDVEITANPSDGWRFVEWAGDHEGEKNPFTATMDSDKKITAIFAEREYPLNIEITGEGTVTEEIVEQLASTEYPHGTTVELTANPNEGWEFSHWEGDIDSEDNPQRLTVDEGVNVTAVFSEIPTYELNISKVGKGIATKELISGNETDGKYEVGSVVELTATPEDGWVFSHWEGDIDGNENPQTITVEEAKNVTAVFEEKRTELKGIILTNTTLSLSESPYQLTEKVQIGYGTRLKIEEGVKIYGKNNVIEVFGDLLIQGSNSSKVKLNHVHIQPGDNSINELYHIEIHHVNMIGGEIYTPSGRSTYGSITLKNSFLYEVNRSGSTETYMYIWYPQKDSYIEGNIFYNAGRLSIGHSDADVYVRNNLFFRNKELSNEIGYAIVNWASYRNSKTFLKNNTFANTQGIAVSMPSGYDSASIDATENYWNSTSSAVIEDMIFDKNDDLSVNEEIPFKPFLNEADSNTPVLPDSLK